MSMPAWIRPHAAIRTDGYVLLAALLTDTPTEDTINLVRNLNWEEDLTVPMQTALTELVHACAVCSLNSIVKEYDRIFVGLGSGELVPYGSWYLEKMIQSAPLAAVRYDLARLGIIRQSGCFESEDHAGALCETMALLSLPENAIPESDQAYFFANHIATWVPQFFQDLQTLDNVGFYRSVGRFGWCFLSAEKEYLRKMRSA
jgi:TorA maturation chaperone TorD